MTDASFGDYLRGKVGSNWVLARRTKRVVERYGADVVCLTPAVYGRHVADFERQTGLAAGGSPGEPCRRIAMRGLELLTALRNLCDVVDASSTSDPDVIRCRDAARELIARTVTGA